MLLQKAILLSVLSMGLLASSCGDKPVNPISPQTATPPPTPTNPTPPTTPPPPVPPPALPRPGSFTLTGSCSEVDDENQRASLTWTQSSNASTYRVERRTRSVDPWASESTTSDLDYSRTVRSNSDHYWRVIAVNTSGETMSNPAESLICREIPKPPEIPGGPGTPTIRFTSLPPKGSTQNLRGSVLHVLPQDHRVVVYIKVGAGWWTKPTFSSPLTSIDAEGRWSTDITTGGFDSTATTVTAFLVTRSHRAVLASGGASVPISVNGRDVLAVVTRNR